MKIQINMNKDDVIKILYQHALSEKYKKYHNQINKPWYEKYIIHLSPILFLAFSFLGYICVNLSKAFDFSYAALQETIMSCIIGIICTCITVFSQYNYVKKQNTALYRKYEKTFDTNPQEYTTQLNTLKQITSSTDIDVKNAMLLNAYETITSLKQATIVNCTENAIEILIDYHNNDGIIHTIELSPYHHHIKTEKSVYISEPELHYNSPFTIQLIMPYKQKTSS